MPSARLLLRAVVGAVIVGLGAGIFGLIGLATGASALDVGRAVAGRTALALAGLALLQYLVVRSAPRSPLWPWIVMAAVAYLLDPLTWTIGANAGGALAGSYLIGVPWVALIVDATVWLAVAVGVSLLARRAASVDPVAQRL